MMVATIHILTEGFDGAYYTGGGATDYYAPAGNVGRWFGEGTKVLGLPAVVDANVFARLLANRHPSRERPLVKKSRPHAAREASPKGKHSIEDAAERIKAHAAHRPGFDVTLSVPKSVSALMAVADELLCRDLEAACDRAAKATLTWAEQNIRLTRRGLGGKQWETAKLVIALFDHDTNRNGDPDWHRHAVVINACQAADGRWLTLNSRELHHWVRTLGPIFRCQLGAELNRLGVKLTRHIDERGRPESWAEIDGVPKSLRDCWSSRRSEIEQALAGEGGLGKASSRARSRANKQTRRNKEQSVPNDVKQAGWRAKAAEHGFGEEQVRKLAGRSDLVKVDPEVAYRRAWEAALAKLTESEAFFPERKVIQLVCEELQESGIGIDSILSWIQRDLAVAKDVVPLATDEGAIQYSTRANWELEERLLKVVDDFRARHGVTVSTERVEAVLAERPQLSTEQADAVRKLTTEKSALRILTGVAGSGKSHTLDAIRAALEAEGMTVIGGALSGAAKEELRAAAGIPSRTIASYLYHLGRAEQGASRSPVKLTATTVVVLDEAGMLDSATLLKLARYVEKAGATLILVGDDRQIQPIQAGGPFHHLVKQGVTASLQNNRRQVNPHDAEAVQDLRQGNAERAVNNYARRGRITLGKNRIDTIDKLVGDWVKRGGATSPADHFIFTQTRAEARLVNRLCQAERQDRLPYASTRGVTVGQERLFVGDRVLFHKAYRLAGIENGYRGTVLAVNPIRRTITIRLDGRSMTRQSPVTVVTVPFDRLGAEGVTPGYAATSHKLQGGTVEHSYMLLGGMTDQQMGYVQATRGKQSTRLFVDKHHADDELRGLVADLKRSRIKKLAHDLAPTLHLKIEPS